ncbi:MAG: isochorismatase family cysteine hydrolase [Pseudomonadota bacterium]
MKACLLLIDLQNDFLSAWSPRARAALLDRTNHLISEFRAQDLGLIWIYQTFKADLSDAFLEMRDYQISTVIEGTPGAEIDATLDVRDADLRIHKKRYSGFFETKLDEVLAEIDPEYVVIAGVNTHACIRMTAIDAYQRDLRVILASDCIGSLQTAHAEITLDYLKDKIVQLMTSEEIAASLR